jgi:hypothetical protein
MALYMAILGFGLGLVMQVLVLAVQNAVSYEQLGVATSGATLFRSIGGSIGTAVLGAIFANRLATELAVSLPAGAPAGASAGQIDPAGLRALPEAVRLGYIEGFTSSMTTVFLVASGIVAIAWLLAWLVPERPLRKTVETAGIGEAFASPRSSLSLDEAVRELTVAIGRESTRDLIQQVSDRSGLGLSVGEAWLMGRLRRGIEIDPDRLAEQHSVDAGRLRGARDGLIARGLIELDDGKAKLTGKGQRDLARLTEARIAVLEALVADWSPEADEALAPVIEKLAEELSGLEQPEPAAP